MSAVLEVREPSAKYLVTRDSPLVQHFDVLATAPGGVARLRELILTLAVQGKLVPQDPSEESASVLLRKIRAAKERMVVEAQIKRSKLIAPDPTDLRPFALPKGWAWTRLTDIASISGGATPSKANPSLWNGDIPWVSPKDMKVAFISDAQDHIADTAIQGSLSLIPSGSLLMVVRGMILAHSFPVARTLAPVTINQDMKALTPIEPALLPFMALICGGMKCHVMRLVERSTHGTCKLESEKIFGMAIPLPPLAEQARIVTRVEELMRLCDALEAKGRLEAAQHGQLVTTLLGTLTDSESPEALADRWQRIAVHFDILLDRPDAVDALEQTILQLAVRGLLVPQDPRDEPARLLLKRIRIEKDRLISEGRIKRDKPLPPLSDRDLPFRLPSAWMWARLGDLGESFDYGSSQKAVEDSTAVPILRMGNIQGGQVVMTNLKYLVDHEGELPSLLLRRGDLLFNRTNSFDLVGKTGLFEGFQREVTFASYLIRIRPAAALCSPEYINMYMNTLDCRKNEIEPDLTQQTGQANYNGTKLKSIRIPLPPLAEQSRIVARVEELRRLCADLRQRLAASQRTQAHLAEALVESAAL